MADPVSKSTRIPEAAPATPPRGADRESIPGLLKDVRDQTTLLLRQEVALAKTELSEKLARLVRNAVFLVAGGLIAFAGLLFLLHAATGAIAKGLEGAGMQEQAPWLAPLIVGVVVTLGGVINMRKGISTIKRESLVPEKTLDSLKEDKAWMQNKVS